MTWMFQDVFKILKLSNFCTPTKKALGEIRKFSMVLLWTLSKHLNIKIQVYVLLRSHFEI